MLFDNVRAYIIAYMFINWHTGIGQLLKFRLFLHKYCHCCLLSEFAIAVGFFFLLLIPLLVLILLLLLIVYFLKLLPPST